MKKRILLIIMACITAFSCVACGGNGGPGGGNNKNTTKLYVAYVNAGFGSKWLEAAKTRFETMYKNFVFEEGKRGVEVVLDPVNEADMSTIMGTKRSHVYFSEYFRTEQYTTLSADITKAVTTSLGESYGQDLEGTALPGYAGETESILDKMTDLDKEYFYTNIGGGEKVCIATPFMDTWDIGLNYDAKMFEDNGLYFNKNNQLGGSKAANDLGTGPDGVPGNADDGLPRTYAEFFTLCDYMQTQASIVPFVFCGNWPTYTRTLAQCLAMTNLGYDNVQEMFTGEGTIPDYLTFASNTSDAYTIQEKAFTKSNYTDIVSKSESFYKALEFIYTIVNKGYCVAENVFDTTYTGDKAQEDFIFGKKLGRNKNKDYGFLVDGTWMYIESAKPIELYEDRYNSVEQDHDFKFMPLPKANEESFERTKGENLIYSHYYPGITIKKGLTPMIQLLAETFVRFYSTDESLIEYTKITSVPRSLMFEATKEQYNSFSAYGKTTYDMHNQINGYETIKIHSIQRKELFAVQNPGLFNASIYLSKPDGFGTLQQPVTNFKDYAADGLTARKYFEALKWA